VEVWPVRTNAAFLARALSHPDFVAGQVDTGFIDARLPELVPAEARPSPDVLRLAAAAAVHQAPAGAEPASPWAPVEGLLGWRLNAEPRARVRLQHGSGVIEVEVTPADLVYAEDALIEDQEDEIVVFEDGEAIAFTLARASGTAGEAAGGSGQLTAPMPGRIVSVSAKPGDVVKKGQPVVTLEAMKMEHGLTAPFDGRVAEINARVGEQVTEGAVLARLEPGKQ
jgi:acetyl/propionyl-CoA carboxylase alpha subunit